eukprot:9234740-Prorocentrum_lima.AAC.1
MNGTDQHDLNVEEAPSQDDADDQWQVNLHIPVGMDQDDAAHVQAFKDKWTQPLVSVEASDRH